MNNSLLTISHNVQINLFERLVEEILQIREKQNRESFFSIFLFFVLVQKILFLESTYNSFSDNIQNQTTVRMDFIRIKINEILIEFSKKPFGPEFTTNDLSFYIKSIVDKIYKLEVINYNTNELKNHVMITKLSL